MQEAELIGKGQHLQLRGESYNSGEQSMERAETHGGPYP